MHRNQAGSHWVVKWLLYSLSTALGGAVTGAALGAVGGLLSVSVRVALGTLFALGAVIIGGALLAGRKIRPVQCDRETPQRWVHWGPWLWPIVNGLTLGFAMTTRIGFMLWYSVPLGSLLFGRPDLGALIYGLYGLARGAGALVIYVRSLHHEAGTGWVFQHTHQMQRITNGQLFLLGTITAIALGL